MIKRNKLRGENFMKIFVDGREVRQTVVADAIEVLLECVEALKNGGNEKHPPEQIAKINSSWSNYRKFLIPPAENALRGIESESDLRLHSGIVEIEADAQTVFSTQRAELSSAWSSKVFI